MRLPKSPADEEMIAHGWMLRDGRWAKQRKRDANGQSKGWDYYKGSVSQGTRIYANRSGERLVAEGTNGSMIGVGVGEGIVAEGTYHSRVGHGIGENARRRLDALTTLWAMNVTLATVYSSLSHTAAEGRSLFHGTTKQAWELHDPGSQGT